MDHGDPPAPTRGRPKTRYADRAEQVRQNMRLYRARLAAEQASLGKALEVLLEAVESGDAHRSFAAGAAVAGIWRDSLARSKVQGARKGRGKGEGVPEKSGQPSP